MRDTWDRMTVTIKGNELSYIRERCINRKEGCPTLRKNWFLDFLFEERAELGRTSLKDEIALGADLGINNVAVCNAIDTGGAVCGRRFLKLPHENDHLRRGCNLVRRVQREPRRCRTSGKASTARTKSWR